MRYRLRTLMILTGMAPPFIASVWFDLPLTALVIAYFGSLAAIFPAAVFLWRNGPPRMRV
jgi:hypothetical protein